MLHSTEDNLHPIIKLRCNLRSYAAAMWATVRYTPVSYAAFFWATLFRTASTRTEFTFIQFFECRNAGLSDIRSIRYQNDKSSDAGTRPLPE